MIGNVTCSNFLTKTKTHKKTVHFVCVEEKKQLVLFCLTFEAVVETHKMASCLVCLEE